MNLHFEWDGAKADSNERKHGVAFTLAASVFRDPRIRSIFDEQHSGSDERWIALGMAANGALLVVIHNWTEVDNSNIKVRIICPKGHCGRTGAV